MTPDPAEEITERWMPVNAEGQAIGPTIALHESGREQRLAYWVDCCACRTRHPFFSPADRDAWAEVHRADTQGHPVILSVEPWNYVTPP